MLDLQCISLALYSRFLDGASKTLLIDETLTVSYRTQSVVLSSVGIPNRHNPNSPARNSIQVSLHPWIPPSSCNGLLIICH